MIEEIFNINGKWFNLNKEEMMKLLEIEDSNLYDKYMYYLSIFRLNLEIDSFEDGIIKFLNVVEKEETKVELLSIYLRHEKILDKSVFGKSYIYNKL